MRVAHGLSAYNTLTARQWIALGDSIVNKPVSGSRLSLIYKNLIIQQLEINGYLGSHYTRSIPNLKIPQVDESNTISADSYEK